MTRIERNRVLNLLCEQVMPLLKQMQTHLLIEHDENCRVDDFHTPINRDIHSIWKAINSIDEIMKERKDS